MEKDFNILELVSPSFIFLDINMPKKNGFEALKHIRSKERSHQPRVIMCSTSSSPHEMRMSQELGADMYVTKPNRIEHLSKMIKEVFEMDWTGKAKESMPEKLLLSHVQ